MSIPIVIFHTRGNQSYFRSCVENNSINNIVYLIGDDSNKLSFVNNPNVHFCHIDGLETEESNQFKDCFVNYSSNNREYEMYCFLRIFYLREFIKKTGKPWVFHIDSDCLVLCDVNHIFAESSPSISYSIQNMENPFHMVGSVHNGLLNTEFCDKFIGLCFDIYKNKSKFELIDRKLQWHKKNSVPGGICDMTLYYLLKSENLLCSVTDLNSPIIIEGEQSIFDHNISDAYGYLGEDTYAKLNGVKIIARDGKKFYFKKNDGTFIRTLSLHFQGGAKRILETIVL